MFDYRTLTHLVLDGDDNSVRSYKTVVKFTKCRGRPMPSIDKTVRPKIISRTKCHTVEFVFPTGA